MTNAQLTHLFDLAHNKSLSQEDRDVLKAAYDAITGSSAESTAPTFEFRFKPMQASPEAGQNLAPTPDKCGRAEAVLELVRRESKDG